MIHPPSPATCQFPSLASFAMVRSLAEGAVFGWCLNDKIIQFPVQCCASRVVTAAGCRYGSGVLG